MTIYINILFCIFYSSIVHSSIFSNLQGNQLPSLLKSNREIVDNNENRKNYKENTDHEIGSNILQNQDEIKNVIKDGKSNEKQIIKSNVDDIDIEKQLHHKQYFSSHENAPKRRYINKKSESDSSSSSMELKNWKDEWRDHWLQKKLEAINSTIPKGDMVNMVAARPWGVPCGDPNQHDIPWGTCMLPLECEAEYRIYRGDYYCGRTKFICCGIQLTNYDMYGGFDVSFADSSLATDSEEKKNRDRGSKERKRRKRIRDRRKRLRARKKRKRRIKRAIKKITREIRKILNRSYRNGTKARKRKTKQLKKYIKELKKKYKKDRLTVKDIHEMEMIKIDDALQKRLDDMRHTNREFTYNDTFRDIIVNGTINKKSLKMLVKAYPELGEMIDTRRQASPIKHPDYLDYDIEYGYLYY